MKLGSLKSKESLDGELIVVSDDLRTAVRATNIAPCLRVAVENWKNVEAKLKQLGSDLKLGKAKDAFELKEEQLHSCLPRTWLFADGSAFINHIRLVRKARNAAPPETLETVPLMYQAESGQFLAPTDPIPQIDFAHGTDFEAEVGVITDFVPMGTDAESALSHICLVTLINDISLRGLIPGELALGFGFFQGKPNKSLSPVAVTLDELGEAWKKGRLELPLNIHLNGKLFGSPNAKEMHFHFGQLIAHAARTRNLPAGTIIGSGTVSNENSNAGSGCLVEKRTLEQLQNGQATTPFMKIGDSVEIWMSDQKGRSIFGRILQSVKKA